MTTQDEAKLKEQIYKTLFDKSRVDGTRLINEDEWPIDELLDLFHHQETRIREVLNPEYPNLTPVWEKTKAWYRLHEKMGADIVFNNTEDEYGVIRQNPVKAIYESPLVKFKEVISLKTPDQTKERRMTQCPRCDSQAIWYNKELIHDEPYDECQNCGYQQKSDQKGEE